MSNTVLFHVVKDSRFTDVRRKYMYIFQSYLNFSFSLIYIYTIDMISVQLYPIS